VNALSFPRVPISSEDNRDGRDTSAFTRVYDALCPAMTLASKMQKPEESNSKPPSVSPQAVLFACGLNSVRSPMAAALLKQMLGGSLYVGSAGVRKGELDPFATAAMEEIGIDIHAHRPMTFEELEDLEGLNFDLIVTLSPEAHHKALELTRTLAAEVEYWPTADPTAIEGSRGQRLDAYRAVRDQLLARIRTRFVRQRSSNE
jgi:protein-tyrosine-phosphatase